MEKKIVISIGFIKLASRLIEEKRVGSVQRIN
jgi:hypothetical protein